MFHLLELLQEFGGNLLLPVSNFGVGQIRVTRTSYPEQVEKNENGALLELTNAEYPKK